MAAEPSPIARGGKFSGGHFPDRDRRVSSPNR